MMRRLLAWLGLVRRPRLIPLPADRLGVSAAGQFTSVTLGPFVEPLNPEEREALDGAIKIADEMDYCWMRERDTVMRTVGLTVLIPKPARTPVES
jgi:hypothetical protein